MLDSRLLLFLSMLACGNGNDPADTSVENSDTGDTGGSDTVPTCDDGLALQAFDASAEGSDYDGMVGDVTLTTLDGDWTLSENWTGCDVYIFINYHPNLYIADMFSSDVAEWLESSPRNVHWFFTAFSSSDSTINEYINTMYTAIDQELNDLEPELADHWRDRIHYVTDSAYDIGGGIGTINSNYGLWGLGIDRHQTFREIGYLSDPATGWNTVPLEFLRYEAEIFNFEANRQADLDAVDATILTVFDDEHIADWGWAGKRGYAEVEFPDATEMAEFDTLEMDLTLGCGHPEYDACPEWDYTIYAYLCDADDPDNCGTEFGRWITAYAREGRWVHDVSPFLADLKDGGTRKIGYYTTQGYDVTLTLRLSNQGKTDAPNTMAYLWSGGTFNADYNSNHEDINFTPPAGTTRVELMTVTSGHGYSSDPNNCGEFCNHQHEFTINGQNSHTQEFPEANETYGCADATSEIGVTPNQYGTWVYGRGGWCPGLEVSQWVVDITDEVTVAEENTIAYRGLLNGAERTVESTDGYIILSSWLVYSQ